MSEFVIEFKNFAVFVHHADGLTAVLGRPGHGVRLSKNGVPLPPPAAGTELKLEVTNGAAPVALGVTAPCSGVFVPHLDWMHGRATPPRRDKVLGADFAGQNARIQLHGGRLVDLEAEGPRGGRSEIADTPWDFREFLQQPAPHMHLISNRMHFHCPVTAGSTYRLVGGATSITLGADDTLKVENADDGECPKVEPLSITRNEEEVQLLDAVGVSAGRARSTLAAADATFAAAAAGVPAGTICKPCNHYCAQL